MFKHVYSFINKVKSQLSEKGQGMVEYALIIAFVAGIAAFALNSDLGETIKNAFGKANEAVSTVNTNASTDSTDSTTP